MRRALITGGNRGVGAAIAAGLRLAGIDVTVGVRTKESALASPFPALVMDLSQPDRLEEVIGSSPFDILVNNAGVLFDRPMFEDREGFAMSMSVMVTSPYELTRLLSPHMIEAGYGRIVNVSSIWGSFLGGLGGGIAKAALNGLTVTACRDLPSYIKVNSMCPGWVRTRMGGEDADRTVEEGGETALWLATLPDDGPSGCFFRDKSQIPW